MQCAGTVDQARPMLVRALVLEAEGVLSVVLEPTGVAPAAEWGPGAHVDVVVPDGSARQYSLCSSPADSPRLRIAVRHDPAGRGGSDWIHRTVRPGDVLQVRGPRNHFALEDAPGYLFLAGGIGITPLLPMVREAAARNADWQLLYFGRSRTAMAFLAELAGYGDRVRVLAADEPHGADLTTLLTAAAADHLVYCCGPTRLTTAVEADLTASGRRDRLRTEYFAAPVEAEPRSSDSFRVLLERSGTQVKVAAGQSVLEAVTAAGADVLSDCEEGICGSCETRVLAGRVDHRDHVLTAAEKQQDDCMMVCVSRALSAELVLDL